MPIFTGTNGPDEFQGGGEDDIFNLFRGDDVARGGIRTATTSSSAAATTTTSSAATAATS
jgi:hypothetical protein